MEHDKLHIKKWENHKLLTVSRNVWSPSFGGLVFPLPGASSMRFFLLLTAPTTAQNRRSMADNKRWFKVWNSILIDPGFDSLPNDCVGIWTKLGALISKHGSDGSIKVAKTQFCKWTNTQENEIEIIQNNLLKVNVSIITNDNGNISVTFNNWKKYQEITDSYARVKKWRMKRNETVTCNVTKEEKRREEKRDKNIQNTPDNFLEKLKENTAYKGIDIDKEISKMDAWLLTPRGKGRRKTKGFIVNWLNKIDVALPTQEVSDWRG